MAREYIIRPLVTEKMTGITEKASHPIYGFVVRPEANKLQIKQEVEGRYGVSVKSVRTIRYAGKKKTRYTRSGILRGRTMAFKKALVVLQDGDNIDFYKDI